MIAKIEPAFSSISTLSRKIDYQLEKISSGEAKELFNSTGDSLSSFSDYMFLFSSLNDRVKLPYSEITLNLSPGERLSEANWINLSKEYMEKMGYGNCCYSIILNKDKEHSHVHILHSRIDSEGKSVSNSLDYKRSEKLARELEKKYNLVSLKENERTKERLSSISGQRYYFDNALKKALRNYAVKERVMHILSSSGAAELLGDRLQKSKLSNEEWMSDLIKLLLQVPPFRSSGPICRRRECICVLQVRKRSPIMFMACLKIHFILRIHPFLRNSDMDI